MAINGNQGFVGFRGGNGQAQGFGQDDREKALGFLNFYLPGPDGEPAKVGKGIAIRQGYGNERMLAQQLNEAMAQNPEALKELCEILLENLEVRWVPMRDQDAPTAGFQLKRKTQP
jgi:hypothetical protein